MIPTLLSLSLFVLSAPQVDWDPYAAFLRQAVTPGGLVRYSVVKEQLPFLEPLAKAIAQPGNLEGLSKNEALALGINAYNFSVLKLVAGHYPVKSVKEIPGFFDQNSVVILGKKWSLNAWEKVLREYGDPHVHFAVNCAAIGCPVLRGVPYTAKDLEAELKEQTLRFAQDPRQVVFSKDLPELRVSMLFDWYAADFLAVYRRDAAPFKQFGEKEGAAVWFLQPFLQPPLPPETLTRPEFQVKFLEYDWSLNDAATAHPSP